MTDGDPRGHSAAQHLEVRATASSGLEAATYGQRKVVKYMPKLDLENASLAAKKWFSEGKAEGKAEVLLRLLGRRFGDVAPRYQQAIANAAIEDLDQWLDRAIDAESLDAVFVPTAH